MKRFWKIVPVVILLLAVAAGFAERTRTTEASGPESDSGMPEYAEPKVQEEHEKVPESYMIEGDNYFDYQPGLECSAFASAYVLRHFGEAAEGLELYKDYPQKISGGGVAPYGIEMFFNDAGYRAEYKCDGTIGELKKQVSRGTPVIVFIHVEEPYDSTHNTHYVPVVGYDKDNLYFAESLEYLANCKDEKGISYNRRTEITKFEKLWLNIDGMWDNPYFIITNTTNH